MSTEKLSELSKPVAYDYQIAGACIADGHNENGKWVDWNNKLSRYCPPDWMVEEGKVTELKPLYSQEYVSALTQRIAELEHANKSQDDHINQQQDRIDSLEKKNASLGQRLGEAEKRIIELDYLRLSACEVFKEIGSELGCNTDNESIMMAIDALNERLANRDAQPVAWASTASLKRGDVREVWPNGEQHKAGKLCITALYTAPPAPAVVKLPTEFHSDEGVMVRLEQVMAALALIGVKYERKGDACRAAMLAAAPEGGNDHDTRR